MKKYYNKKCCITFGILLSTLSPSCSSSDEAKLNSSEDALQPTVKTLLTEHNAREAEFEKARNELKQEEERLWTAYQLWAKQGVGVPPSWDDFIASSKKTRARFAASTAAINYTGIQPKISEAYMKLVQAKLDQEDARIEYLQSLDSLNGLMTGRIPESAIKEMENSPMTAAPLQAALKRVNQTEAKLAQCMWLWQKCEIAWFKSMIEFAPHEYSDYMKAKVPKFDLEASKLLLLKMEKQLDDTRPNPKDDGR